MSMKAGCAHERRAEYHAARVTCDAVIRQPHADSHARLCVRTSMQYWCTSTGKHAPKTNDPVMRALGTQQVPP